MTDHTGHMAPRFTYFTHPYPGGSWYVLDNQHPDVEPGQATEIAACRTVEHAKMLAMTLNAGLDPSEPLQEDGAPR